MVLAPPVPVPAPAGTPVRPLQGTLYPRTAHVLRYIAQYRQHHGYAPSLREVCRACAISSTSVANYHVMQLADRGLIIAAQLPRQHMARSWQLTAAGHTYLARHPLPVPGTSPSEPVAAPEATGDPAVTIPLALFNALTGTVWQLHAYLHDLQTLQTQRQPVLITDRQRLALEERDLGMLAEAALAHLTPIAGTAGTPIPHHQQKEDSP